MMSPFVASLFMAVIQPNPAVIQKVANDARVYSFMKAMTDLCQCSCTFEEKAWTADCNGQGDFQSCTYKAQAVCAPMGIPGPQFVDLKAEYFPLGNLILDVTMSAEFKQ